MDYLNLDLEITHEAGHDYRVTVRSPAGRSSPTERACQVTRLLYHRMNQASYFTDSSRQRGVKS